jgi:hypothetical protein
MTLRHALFGLAVVFGFSVWSACRPCEQAAQAQGADPVYAADEVGTHSGGNHDDAARRYRANQSTHWRQVAIGMRGNCP